MRALALGGQGEGSIGHALHVSPPLTLGSSVFSSNSESVSRQPLQLKVRSP